MKRFGLALVCGLAAFGLSSCFYVDFCGPIGPPPCYDHGYYDHGYPYGGGFDYDVGMYYDPCW